MRMLRRLLVAATFIFALIALPAVADDAVDALNDALSDDVFTEQPIQEGMNRAIVITECGKILMVIGAIFDGPEDVKGKLLLSVRPWTDSEIEADWIMANVVAELIIAYKADGPIIELAELTDRLCV